MRKIDYLVEVEKELKKYELNNRDELMDQVRNIVEITNIEDVEIDLGTPQNFAVEIMKNNGINPVKKYDDDHENSSVFSRISNSSFEIKDDVININVSMSSHHYKVPNCKKIVLHTTCARVFLDISEIKNDVELFINAHFSEINLTLLQDTYIVDNSSIIIGTNIFDLDNNVIDKSGNIVKIEGKLVASAINTLEAR